MNVRKGRLHGCLCAPSFEIYQILDLFDLCTRFNNKETNKTLCMEFRQIEMCLDVLVTGALACCPTIWTKLLVERVGLATKDFHLYPDVVSIVPGFGHGTALPVDKMKVMQGQGPAKSVQRMKSGREGDFPFPLQQHFILTLSI